MESKASPHHETTICSVGSTSNLRNRTCRGGFYLALLFQKQIEILVGSAILFAFLTWLGSGADFIGLFRDMFKQAREKEAKRKTAIYAQLEPLFASLRGELFFALEAYNQKNSVNYSAHLASFQSMMDQQYAKSGFRQALSNASEVYDKFLSIHEKIQQSFRNNGNYGSLIAEKGLASFVQRATEIEPSRIVVFVILCVCAP
jgi:hypothetical protein